MHKIKKYVDHIDEELCGAKEYAEKYLWHKAKGHMSNADKYKTMASDELRHAMLIHDIAMEDIETLKGVYTPTAEMEDMWEHSHKHYVEKTAWIKQMLNM